VLVRPYYEHAGITIFHGDCRDVLPHVTADLLCFDPPYGTNEHGGYGRRQLGLETIEGDDDTAVRDFVLSTWGARPAVVFGSPRRPEPAGSWDYRLVWDKRMPGLGAPWRWQHEMIYLRGEWRNSPGIPSVLSFSAGGSMRDRLHPHEKPECLMRALLVGSSGSIVDATMGSGSTLRAAMDLGRRAIGIDIEEKYCEIAAKRLSQEVLFA
jgi:site-specific DNA-methyltransferase (adenine-specific)